MTKINAQFSDSEETKILAVFSCPQGDEYQNQSEIDSSDPRYIFFYNSLPLSIRETLPSAN